MKIRIAAVTDAGKERVNNEDAFSFCPDLCRPDWSLSDTESYVTLGKWGALAIVADGMGGANAGEVASSIAVETATRCFSATSLETIVGSTFKMRELLLDVIKQTDSAIVAHVKEEPDTIGMGTTVVMLWITTESVLAAWCGDSRCYAFNLKNGLKRLSKDHSYVQELIDKREITEEQAFTHPDNNIICRCLGDVDSSSEPEFTDYEVRPGEIFLLCSDGLCGYCKDRQIEKTLYKEFADTKECRNALLRLAYEAGGQDNITVVVVSLLADDSKLPDAGRFAYIKRRIRKWLVNGKG